jgi:hypothetical protein
VTQAPPPSPGKEIPWNRRYAIPLGGAQAGGTGHVADHNAIAASLPALWAETGSLHENHDKLASEMAGQLPELWAEIGRLHVKAHRQAIAILVGSILIAAFGILVILSYV